MKVICVFMYVYVPFAVKVRVRAVCPLVVSNIGGLCSTADLVIGGCDGIAGTADCWLVTGISMSIMMNRTLSSVDVFSI